MHFVDRYMLSMLVGAAALVVLSTITSLSWGLLRELPHMWFVFAGVNTIRLIGGKR